ncbi:hypothetical protein HG530_009865 [Fusarium avenaceum]|nr:hypothetical protein HG530_009865 [Fusarium avenaceum]
MMRSPRLSPTRGDALLRLLSLDCTVVRDLVLFDLEVALLRDLFLGLRSFLLRKLRYVEVSPEEEAGDGAEDDASDDTGGQGVLGVLVGRGDGSKGDA